MDVFSAAEIETAGASETMQIIQTLAPSFNFPRPTITDGTDTVRPATLRGLGSDQVLVLINGKRRHTSALVHVNGSIGRGSTGVDLNAIPASAIENIEILRDGAAAQYGSDAIAGVINVVLKSGASDTALNLKTGADDPLRWRADRHQRPPRLGAGPRLALRHRRVSRPQRDQPRRPGPATSRIDQPGRSSPTITGETPKRRTSWASSTPRCR